MFNILFILKCKSPSLVVVNESQKDVFEDECEQANALHGHRTRQTHSAYI